MKNLYYLAMHKLYFGLFLLALNWANEYETVNKFAEASNRYWKKISA